MTAHAAAGAARKDLHAGGDDGAEDAATSGEDGGAGCEGGDARGAEGQEASEVLAGLKQGNVCNRVSVASVARVMSATCYWCKRS